MAKLQGLKEGKTYYNIYKEEWTQHFPMGLEIYHEVHENPRAFFSSSSPILLESSIQYPWGVGLHHLVRALIIYEVSLDNVFDVDPCVETVDKGPKPMEELVKLQLGPKPR